MSHHIRVVENFGPDLPLLFKLHKIWSVILRKIIKIGVTRCQIFMLKCTKRDFGWGSAPDPAGGAYSTPPDPLAGLRGPTSKGRGGKGKGRGRGKGREGEWRRERGRRRWRGRGVLDLPLKYMVTLILQGNVEVLIG